MGDWMQIVSSVGFPIAAAGYMAWLNSQQTKRFDERLDSIIKDGKVDRELVSVVKDAVDNNTKALLLLADRKGESENARDRRIEME